MAVSSVSNLISNLKRPARSNRFKVTISKSGFTDKAEYMCHTANLPSRTFATLEQKTYGPIEKFPYLTTYNDLDLSFYVQGSNDNIYKDFSNWLNEINPRNTNDFKYKDDYITDIVVTHYNDFNKVINQIKFVDAYPISMNQLDLDWSSESFHNLTVTFAYTYWEEN